jgi:CRP-like cAMP-binding protein
MHSRNLLLSGLPADVRNRLAAYWMKVELERGDILHLPGQEILHLYFPLDSLISITVTMDEATTAEAGIVGSREMVGINAFMGGSETTQTQYVCQSPGSAVRVPAEPFLEEFDTNKQVRDIMLRFTQAYIAQLSQNVACNRLHSIEKRMARWLLECRGRLHTDDLNMTHEFISQMLGVRRASITDAIGILEGRGLITSRRGSISIVDSNSLEDASCECFRVLWDEYNRLLGPAIGQSRQFLA